MPAPRTLGGYPSVLAVDQRLVPHRVVATRAEGDQPILTFDSGVSSMLRAPSGHPQARVGEKPRRGHDPGTVVARSQAQCRDASFGTLAEVVSPRSPTFGLVELTLTTLTTLTTLCS